MRQFDYISGIHLCGTRTLTNSLEKQTIALAGLFLATELVQTIATSGQYPDSQMRIALESLFRLDAESAESVYGTKSDLRPGYQRLVEQLAGSRENKPDMQITHYTLTLLKLEQKCHSNQTMMERIRRGIESAQQMRTHYETLDPEIISLLAKIYTDNISELTPRVVVHGSSDYLKQDSWANCIRACLLAGVRAAVLWRQCGGTRWKIVSGRQRYVNQAKKELGLA